ncbi:GDSL-type esterase/lipase family protein [Botrimarina sp.]|uniref:SGNH/GDSL hydrolase family protein n=1 Tax=Botrimarina sp. TaxID=2795802 RepID=UPI0032F041C0
MTRDVEGFVGRLASGEELCAVLLGDSITAGSQIDPHADPTIVYHQQWHDRLVQTNSDVALRRVNRGVPGDKVGDGAARFNSDVLPHQPDLLVIAFGINDCWEGPAALSRFGRGLETLALRAIDETPACVALMTTNMMNHRVSEEVLQMAPFARQSMRAQVSGWTTLYMRRVREVAESLQLPIVDGYAKWQAYADRGNDPDGLLANGANHPNRQGHALLAEALWETVGVPSGSG